jgi:hypothetical protein
MSNGKDPNTNFGHADGVDLRDLITAQIQNLHTLIEANDKSYDQRFQNVVEATKSALASADRAVTKAESATEKRFEGVNEFRNTLSDQQRTFVPRAEVTIKFDSLDDRLKRIEDKILSIEGSKSGLSQGWGWAVGVVGLVAAVVAILSKLF